jgi:hypothetical protein
VLNDQLPRHACMPNPVACSDFELPQSREVGFGILNLPEGLASSPIAQSKFLGARLVVEEKFHFFPENGFRRTWGSSLCTPNMQNRHGRLGGEDRTSASSKDIRVVQNLPVHWESKTNRSLHILRPRRLECATKNISAPQIAITLVANVLGRMSMPSERHFLILCYKQNN